MLHRKIIGQNLRKIRKACGWSQERLSDKSGFDQDYIGHLERGQVNVSADTLAKLAETLKVKIVDFFEE